MIFNPGPHGFSALDCTREVQYTPFDPPSESVRRCTKRTQVEPAALGVGNNGRVDLRGRIGVREEQEAVAVVRRAALRVRGDVPCVVHARQLLGCGGEADVRPMRF